MIAGPFRYPAMLDQHEREVEAECVPLPVAPFYIGDRVVRLAHPQDGALLVQLCQHIFGYWRVECLGPHGVIYSAPADKFVLRPEGWFNPPAPPVSATTTLELSTDGVITREQWADAHEADASADHAAELADWYLGMADWWTHVGALVDPELAQEQARIARNLAGRIVEDKP